MPSLPYDALMSDIDDAGPVETGFPVYCPYCGEPGEVYIEPDVLGTLVQDCEVCCNPWQVRVGYDQGERYVEVTKGDGSE
jgi:hypothetical protein